MIIGVRAIVIAQGKPLQALASLAIGAVLAAVSLRRSWGLLQEAEASPRRLSATVAGATQP